MISTRRISSVFLLAAMLLTFTGAALAAEPGGKSGGYALRAMSFNILRGDLNGPDHLWESRKDACIEMLKARKPDILGTVECNSIQREDILQSIPGYGYVGISVNGDSTSFPNTSSNTIFYDKEKLQLEKWGTIWLSDTPDTVSNTFYYRKARTATWARFSLKGGEAHLVYVCVHLQDNSSGRKRQYADKKAYYGSECRRKSVALIVSKLPEINPDAYPILLGGDLNCSCAAEELYDFYGPFDLVAYNSGKSDLGGTYNGFRLPEGGSRIDHLFSSKCAHSLFAVDREAYAGVTYLSDHFPIYTDFTIE